LELFDPASLVVMAQVPIDASSRVRPGMAVEIRMGTAVASGVISALTGTVTPQVLTVPVRIAFTSPLVPPLLHAAVECRIVTAHHDDALLIPTAALLPAGGVGDAAVMVVVDGHAQRRTVALGLRDSEWVEVTSGLAADESVISEGAYGLPDGAAVAPLPAT
ncbi:MAG: HlyD family efflux transporter periplasmic adaptor subunit, partial [bacterium]